MIDLEAVKNCEVIKEPWEHLVIDDFIKEDTFNTLLKIKDYINENKDRIPDLESYVDERNENVFNIKELIDFGVPEEPVIELAKICKLINKHRTDFWKKFIWHRACVDHTTICNAAINFNGIGSWFRIHNDSIYKTISIIVYLDPEEHEIGTTLWKDSERKSKPHRIKWKCNRALVFAPSPHTWHEVEKVSSDRIVLVLTIEFIPKNPEDHMNFNFEHIPVKFSNGYKIDQVHLGAK